MTAPNKVLLRKHFLKLRSSLPHARKQAASKSFFEESMDKLSGFSKVLSFFSFNHEIDLRLTNQYLAKTNRLYLPRMEKDQLRIYHVSNINKQIGSNAFGLFEPLKEKCTEINPEEVELVLVPGLVFDLRGHRIGYGKGYYDRLLKQVPHILSWGIGYKEQLSLDFLPAEITDIPVTKLQLF